MSDRKPGPEATIGGRIAQARFALAARLGRNVTQAWLAGEVGVSGPTVSQWEAGVTEPTLSSVAKIAAALGVSPGWIAWGETQKAAPEAALDDITVGAVPLTAAQKARAVEKSDAKAATSARSALPRKRRG